MLERVPPHDEPAERAVLAAMLLDDRAAEVSVDGLTVDDFYLPRHQIVFKLFRDLFEQSAQVDFVVAGRELSKRDLVERVGGLEFLGQLAEDVVAPGNCEKYVRIVRELSTDRKLQDLGVRLHQLSGSEALEYAEQQLAEIAASHAGAGDPVELQMLADQVAHDALNGEPRETYGPPFGFAGREFDDLTGGAIPGTYWVVAARTSMGKSTFVAALARSLRRTSPDAGSPLIISTEMTPAAMGVEALASEAGVHSRGLKRRNLTATQRANVSAIVDTRSLEGLFVHEMAGRTVGAVRAVAKRHRARHGLPLLVIDLASKLKGTGKTRYEQMSSVSQGLHELKSDLNTCIIATVQVSRGVMLNGSKRPELHHLKDSGSWEEDSDKVLLLHRPGYYGEDDHRTEIIQAKDRLNYGGVRSIYVEYKPGVGRFEGTGDDTEQGLFI